MSPIDLCFSTTNREEFLADLLALEIARAIGSPDPDSPQLLPVESVDLDYVGLLVDVPAVFDYTTTPPTVITPATFHSGERANLRFTGELAEARAATIAAASMAHTTLLAPADVPAAQIRWSGGGEPWTGQASVPPPPPSPDPESLPAAKSRLLARLAHRRWQVETGGFVIGGLSIATDDRSKLMLMGAAEQARRDSTWTARWKTGTGWANLTAAQVTAVADAALAHVQACFALEADLAGQIAAAADSTILAGLAAQVEAFSP